MEQLEEVQRLCCVACGSLLGPSIATIPFRLPGETIDTAAYRCRECGSYVRALSVPEIQAHFSVASYTDPTREAEWRNRRGRFLAYVLDIAERTLHRPSRDVSALDVGCAYGHLMAIMRERGMNPEGVEPTEPLRTLVTNRGYACYASVEAVPANRRFDFVFAIDSLYYMLEPADELTRIRALLAAEGRLVLRIAHRAWYLDLRRWLGLAVRPDDFGGVRVNFSSRGIRRLLERTGFVIEWTTAREKGKRDIAGLMKLYYSISGWLAEVVGLNVSPGLIIIARRRNGT